MERPLTTEDDPTGVSMGVGVLRALQVFWRWVVSLCTSKRTLAINERTFRVEALLGEGATGYVYRVRESGGGGVYAVKELLRVPKGVLLREVEAHTRCGGSPHVLPLLAWSFQDAPTTRHRQQQHHSSHTVPSSGGEDTEVDALLLFPLAQLGSLQGRVVEALGRGRGGGDPPSTGFALGEGEALALCAQVALGVQALHTLGGWAHRDINTRNALLFPSSSSSTSSLSTTNAGGVHADAVVCDLGSVAPLVTPRSTRLEALQVVEEAAQRSSMPYRPPELWQCDPDAEAGIDGEAADVWALGCTLYACLYGVSPFECIGAGGGGLRLCDPCFTRTLGDIAWPTGGGGGGKGGAPTAKRIILDACAKDPKGRISLQQFIDRCRGGPAEGGV